MVCMNYAIHHFKLDKLIQDQFFVEMYRSSMLRGNVKNNTGQFPIPWNNFNQNTNSPLVDLTPEECKILQGSYLCTSGLLFLLQRSKDYWTRIINDAMDYGSAASWKLWQKERSCDQYGGISTSERVLSNA